MFILYIFIITTVSWAPKGCSSVKIAHSFLILDMSPAIKERSNLSVIRHHRVNTPQNPATQGRAKRCRARNRSRWNATVPELLLDCSTHCQSCRHHPVTSSKLDSRVCSLLTLGLVILLLFLYSVCVYSGIIITYIYFCGILIDFKRRRRNYSYRLFSFLWQIFSRL